MLLDEIKDALPNIKIMLITPFILEGRSTKNTDAIPDRFQRLKSGVKEKADAVKIIAADRGLPVIELQPKFDKACEQHSLERLTIDGVNPTPEGHELIKRAWIEVIKEHCGV